MTSLKTLKTIETWVHLEFLQESIQDWIIDNYLFLAPYFPDFNIEELCNESSNFQENLKIKKAKTESGELLCDEEDNSLEELRAIFMSLYDDPNFFLSLELACLFCLDYNTCSIILESNLIEQEKKIKKKLSTTIITYNILLELQSISSIIVLDYSYILRLNTKLIKQLHNTNECYSIGGTINQEGDSSSIFNRLLNFKLNYDVMYILICYDIDDNSDETIVQSNYITDSLTLTLEEFLNSPNIRDQDTETLAITKDGFESNDDFFFRHGDDIFQYSQLSVRISAINYGGVTHNKNRGAGSRAVGLFLPCLGSNILNLSYSFTEEIKSISFPFFFDFPVYSYLVKSNDLSEMLIWGYNKHFGDDDKLEGSLLEVLISVTEDLLPSLQGYAGMMSLVSFGMEEDFKKLINSTVVDLKQALNERSEYSMGRLHSTLEQFYDMNTSTGGFASLFSGNSRGMSSCIQFIQNFICEKLRAIDLKLFLPKLNNLIIESKKLINYFNSSPTPLNSQTKSFIVKLYKFIQHFEVRLQNDWKFNELLEENSNILNDKTNSFFDFNKSDLEFIWSIKPKIMDSFFNTNSSITDAPSNNSFTFERIFGINYLRDIQNNMRYKLYRNHQIENNQPVDYNSSPQQLIPFQFNPTISKKIFYNDFLFFITLNNLSLNLQGETLNIDTPLGMSLFPTFKNNSDQNLISATSSTNLPQYLLEKKIFIQRCLEFGLTYVTSEGGALVFPFPMRRVMVLLKPLSLSQHILNNSFKYSDNNFSPLDSIEIIQDPFSYPSNLMKKLKDMPRVFRNKLKCLNKKNEVDLSFNSEKKYYLSFKINTNFSLALKKLRNHHGDDCWIGKDLELIWNDMYNSKPAELLIFELWIYEVGINTGGEDDKGGWLVAADFGHPVLNGKSVYIATRFSPSAMQNKEGDNIECDNFTLDPMFLRTLQCGFILSLVVSQYLKQNGCYIYDLGGTSEAPLMRYKKDVGGNYYDRHRSHFIFNLLRNYQDYSKEGCCTNQSSLLKSGDIISVIKLNDLLNYNN